MHSYPQDSTGPSIAVPTPAGTPDAAEDQELHVRVAERITEVRRRRLDLSIALFALIGIVAMWILGLYAHATTLAVTADVLKVSAIQEVMLLPLSLIEGAYVLVAPLAVMVTLARRGQLFSVVKAAVVALVAAGCAWGLSQLRPYVSDQITAPLSVTTTTGHQVAFNLVLTAFAALFTMVGERAHMRILRWAWGGLWVITILGMLRGSMTIPSAVISVLIGVMVGALGRWILGFDDRQAQIGQIVVALTRVGLRPTQLVRTDVDTSEQPLTTVLVTGHPGAISEQTVTDLPVWDVTVNRQQPRFGVRFYQMWTEEGIFDVTVNDPGGKLARAWRELWSNIRLKGMTRWVSPSLKASVERGTLTAIAASRLGVRVPEPFALATAGDSVVEVTHSLPLSLRLRDMDAELISDDILDQAWQQLALAHAGAVSHRHLTFNAVVVDHQGHVWLDDWERGEVGASDLAQSIDVVQMLVLQAVCVGRERAVEAAYRVLGQRRVTAVTSLLQEPVLSSDLSQVVRRTDVVERLREDLRSRATIGEADRTQDQHHVLEPLNLQRFKPRTVVMVFVGVLALTVILGSMNFTELKSVLVTANPFWIIAAFLLASLTWVGAAAALMAFTPEKLSFKEAFLVQVAASLMTILVPAGLGPAAVNLQYLTKKRVPRPVALTTVTLQQIVQLLVTVLLLIFAMLATGQSIGITLPYSTILGILGVAILVAAILLLIPRLRSWLWLKILPLWRQITPRLWWLLARPQRLLVILGSNLLMNVGFIGTFLACLHAFGGSASIISSSITYLVSNIVGSTVPSPGGIGPVEAALWGGLQVVGVASSIALSTAVLYRLATFYGRVPFAWVAMHYLQKHDCL